ARPVNAHLAATPKAAPDIRSGPARTPATPKPETKPNNGSSAVKASPARPQAPTKTQTSLLASLSSIERVAANWLRWLRQPIGSSRGPLRGKGR
ncbi:MAG TPA: hypothetical protein VMD78_05870, partial [Candidatus Baltobacteraceae bacterium]|nr:hypothetical protein [Candidatus Baltobacteraceae bacterium]